jgi:hypothetical protein
MNHPEFSNNESSGFFMPRNSFYDGLRTVSHASCVMARNALIAALERRAGRDF